MKKLLAVVKNTKPEVKIYAGFCVCMLTAYITYLRWSKRKMEQVFDCPWFHNYDEEK